MQAWSENEAKMSWSVHVRQKKHKEETQKT